MQDPHVHLDLTDELALLLHFVSNVASEIRMHSAYNREVPEPTASIDVMWLSDCLHNFDMLTQAIVSKCRADIVFACDVLIDGYRRYSVDGSGMNSAASFARAAKRNLFRLEDGISLFQAIMEKAKTGQAQAA